MTKSNNTLIISIMGVDGSGKTTITKSLNKKLKKSKYLHLKPYILFKDRRRVVRNPHLQKKSSLIISFIRIISWLISYKFFFTINNNYKIYLFDRYAHDILIDPLRYKHNLSKNLTKFILSFFPTPNLWVFLNTDTKTIKSRKCELSDNELKHQIQNYFKFFKTQKNVLILNSHKKHVLISRIIKKIINR